MKPIWDVDELAKYWSLTFEEIRLLNTKPVRNHLPFAVQIKFSQNTERFSLAIYDILKIPLHYLADQLDAEVSGI